MSDHENTEGREYKAKRLRPIFRRAAKLVARGWTQKGGYAEKADGGVIMNPLSCEAVCWCLHGAVEAAAGGEDVDASWLLADAGYCSSWNDATTRTQDEVIAVLLEMAEACR